MQIISPTIRREPNAFFIHFTEPSTSSTNQPTSSPIPTFDSVKICSHNSQKPIFFYTFVNVSHFHSLTSIYMCDHVIHLSATSPPPLPMSFVERVIQSARKFYLQDQFDVGGKMLLVKTFYIFFFCFYIFLLVILIITQFICRNAALSRQHSSRRI